jgi:hypothetical protein
VKSGLLEASMRNTGIMPPGKLHTWDRDNPRTVRGTKPRKEQKALGTYNEHPELRGLNDRYHVHLDAYNNGR